MRIVRLALAAVLMLGLSATTTLAAGRPDRSYLPVPDKITFDAGVACAFPLEIDFLVDNEYGITFFDANGVPTRTIVQGRFVIRLVNLDGGASLTVNAGGPEFITYDAAGNPLRLVLTGVSALIPPVSVTELTRGPAVLTIDGSGNPVLQSLTGRQLSICALLS